MGWQWEYLYDKNKIKKVSDVKKTNKIPTPIQYIWFVSIHAITNWVAMIKSPNRATMTSSFVAWKDLQISGHGVHKFELEHLCLLEAWAWARAMVAAMESPLSVS